MPAIHRGNRIHNRGGIMKTRNMVTTLTEQGEVLNIGGAIVSVKKAKNGTATILVQAPDSIKIKKMKGIYDGGQLIGTGGA